METSKQIYTVEVKVPSSEHVAQIVGKGGSKIKALRVSTNTCIKTPIKNEPPVFTIYGQKQGVIVASSAILNASKHFTDLMNARNSTPKPGEITTRVPVPREYIGVVVGRNGSMIIKIKKQTNTRINTPKGDDDYPEFEITGKEINVIAAKEAIMERVNQAHLLRPSAKFDPNLKNFIHQFTE